MPFMGELMRPRPSAREVALRVGGVGVAIGVAVVSSGEVVMDAARIVRQGPSVTITARSHTEERSTLTEAQKINRRLGYTESLSSEVSGLVPIGGVQPAKPKSDCQGQVITNWDGSQVCNTVTGPTPITAPVKQSTEQPIKPVPTVQLKASSTPDKGRGGSGGDSPFGFLPFLIITLAGLGLGARVFKKRSHS
jgi:hypothetical protein